MANTRGEEAVRKKYEAQETEREAEVARESNEILLDERFDFVCARSDWSQQRPGLHPKTFGPKSKT